MAGAAIFDVDGTLTDTNHLHVVAWWEAFRQAGHTVPMPDIHRAVGLGSDDLIERLLGADRDREQDDAISSAHTVLYGTYFDRLPAFRCAGDLLRTLASPTPVGHVDDRPQEDPPCRARLQRPAATDHRTSGLLRRSVHPAAPAVVPQAHLLRGISSSCRRNEPSLPSTITQKRGWTASRRP